MSRPTPFPRRIQDHRRDEPAHSLLQRTAEHHRMRHFDRLFGDLGAVGGATVSMFDPAVIADVCTQDRDSVTFATGRPTLKRVRLLGQELRRQDWTVEYRRWCPECLRDAPYSRACWEVRLLTTCPEHRTALADRCSCGIRVKWKQSGMTYCRCRRSLLAVDVDPVPDEEMACERYIAGRLGSHGPVPRMKLLDGLSLHEVAGALERLGQAALDDAATIKALTERFGRRRLLLEGFQVVAGFPASFRGLLDRLLADAGKRKGRWGVGKAYGGLHAWIARLPKHALGTALKKEIRTHAAKHVRLHRNLHVGGEAPIDQGIYTLVEAADVCGIHFERFRRIAVATGLIPKPKRRKGEPVSIPKAVVDDLARRLDGHKHQDAVAAELGVAPATVRRLVKAGLMVPVVDGAAWRMSDDGNLNRWIFTRDAAAELVSRLESRLMPGSTGGLSPLTDEVYARRTSFEKLLQIILDGKVPVRGVDAGAVGLQRILIDGDEFRRAARGERSPRGTLTEVSKRLGLASETAKALRLAGLIRTERRGRSYIVPEKEVARFDQRYVLAERLAGDLLGAEHGAAAIAVLKRLGIEPVCRPPEFRQTIYLRVKAIPALERYVKEQTEWSRRTPGSLMLTEAIGVLGLDRGFACELAEDGLLRTRKVGRVIEVLPEEVERFRQAYVRPSELAPMVGMTGASAVIRILRKAGVEPVRGRPKFTNNIYSRAEATAAVQAHLAEGGVAQITEDTLAGTLNAKDTKAALGIADRMYMQLVRAGELNPVRQGKEMVLKEAEIRRFKERYVLANELGALIGREDGRSGGKVMTLRLISLGVQPVYGRPDFYSFVFRRDEAAAALRADLD